MRRRTSCTSKSRQHELTHCLAEWQRFATIHATCKLKTERTSLLRSPYCMGVKIDGRPGIVKSRGRAASQVSLRANRTGMIPCHGSFASLAPACACLRSVLRCRQAGHGRQGLLRMTVLPTLDRQISSTVTAKHVILSAAKNLPSPRLSITHERGKQICAETSSA